jgi:SH3-like domain-containing protein
MRNIKLLLIAALICFTSLGQAWAEVGQVTGLPIPRFVSLKGSETNLRKGPNVKYPIAWVYSKKGYPMEITAEFENWRKVRDHDGTEGWVHDSVITGTRNVVTIHNHYSNKPFKYPINSGEVILFRYPDEDSYPMLRAQMNVIGRIRSCDKQWCKIRINDVSGWIKKSNIWGVYPHEIIK